VRTRSLPVQPPLESGSVIQQCSPSVEHFPNTGRFVRASTQRSGNAPCTICPFLRTATGRCNAEKSCSKSPSRMTSSKLTFRDRADLVEDAKSLGRVACRRRQDRGRGQSGPTKQLHLVMRRCAREEAGGIHWGSSPISPDEQLHPGLRESVDLRATSPALAGARVRGVLVQWQLNAWPGWGGARSRRP
jgi:hypothetical protein